MGCWNETCMLSHLQILCGDKIKLIILVHNGGDTKRHNHCYYNEDYAPLTLPIDAVYNDYGGVEKVELTPYTERLLKSLIFKTTDDVEYEYTTVEELVDEITKRSGLYLAERFGGCKKLECVFVHSALYDILVEDFKKRVPYCKQNTVFELYQHKHEKIKELVREYKAIENAKPKTPDLILEEIDLFENIKEIIFKATQFGYSFPIKYVTANSVISEECIDQFFDELANYIMWAMSLQTGRFGYLTRCGAGGSDRDVRVQKLVAQFVLDFTTRKYEDEDILVYEENETIYWYD